jgi:hypothetical protein
MTRAKLLGALLVVLSYSGAGQAIPLINNTGLAGTSRVLTFNVPPVTQGFPVTTEYAAEFGVTFSPNLFYDPQPGAGFSTPSLGNFNLFGGGPHDPVSILFSQAIGGVAFAFETGTAATTLFKALLDGTVIEEFGAPNTNPRPNFFGFKDILFNEIQIFPATGSNLFLLDDLQFSRVPAPGTLALLGLGFAALFFGKRRANTNSVHPPLHKN